MKRILVIDDEIWLRDMVKMALNQRGYDVIEANDGSVGVEVARKELPDLVLCDVNMEKLDGYGTLSALRNDSATATIPFILMTGLADNTGMRHGMELGADDYLPKPFTLDALYGAVEARLKKAKTVQDHAQGALADLRQNLSMMLPHELRTPLNGLLGNAELLASDPSSFSFDVIAEMGREIAESGRALERLVATFLAYSQVEILRADPHVNASLRAKRTANAAQFAEAAARKQADESKRAADLQLNFIPLAVGMSEEYFSKLVSELTHNAFKFSKPGTPVNVSLAVVDEAVVLTVSDRGRGMTADQITKIGAFMQFDRKTHEQQGLGLGLTIARQLAEIHGGVLTVQSELGVGTTATVKLPSVS